ncbi:MAG TPA: APC family permease [Spirochaetia bacterium]|nr:APC family permease [Spirochaetia bacterium]
MDTKLHQNNLSYLEAMAISVAIMAPTAAMALNGSLAASIAGTAVPLTFLLAMITIGLVSYAFIQFNKYVSSSGSVYAFTAASLGPKVGFLSGWCLLFTYLMFTAASSAEIGAFFQTFLGDLGVNIGWFPIAVLCALIIWTLSYMDVRVSARLMLTLEGISVILILILTAVILGRGGATHHLTAFPLTLGHNSFSTVALASVFAFLSFAGFEGASSLGEETKDPTKAIPIAIGAAVFLTGIFYILVSYAQSVGFGMSDSGVKAFASSSAPLSDLAKTYMSTAFAAMIMFGAAISAFSSALGTATTGSRLLYSMGRDGFVSLKLGSVHHKFRSPYIALAVVMVIALVLMSALSGHAGTDVFGYLGTIGVLSLLLAYLTTNIGAIAYFTKRRLHSVTLFTVPVLAVIALGYTLYSNVFPTPPAPYNYFPYMVIAWIVVGGLIVFLSPNLAHNIARRFVDENDISTD